jgi:hypothetical protein
MALVGVAVVSTLAAVLIPAGAYANSVQLVPQLGGFDGSAINVQVDGREVTVHAPDGFVVFRTGETDTPPEVEIWIRSLSGGYNGFRVEIKAGPGPRPGRQLAEKDGRPIYAVQRGRGVSWEIVPGATMTVRSRDGAQAQLLALVDLVET